MDKHDTAWGFIIGIMVGVILGTFMTEALYIKRAIEHGAAHYHPTTGSFTWNDDDE